MIYVVTVHYKSDRWVPIQLRYLRRHIDEPFQIYSHCDKGFGAALEQHGPVCRKVFKGQGSANHSAKLDHLAGGVLKVAAPTDIVLFLDGDAFPISDALMPEIRRWTTDPGLIAIRRENGNSPLVPHPSFCAATAAFWKELPGIWDNSACKVGNNVIQDTGCRLYQRLTAQGKKWHEVLRTNKKNWHPLYFGVYGDIVYHHGAGFRPYTIPSWYGDGARSRKVVDASRKILSLIDRHKDFYNVFLNGKYSEEL